MMLIIAREIIVKMDDRDFARLPDEELDKFIGLVDEIDVEELIKNKLGDYKYQGAKVNYSVEVK